MSILQMKRIRILALSADRDTLLQDLMKLGCIEISSPSAELSDPAWASLIASDSGCAADVASRLNEINSALSIIGKYVKKAKNPFAERRAVSCDRFFDRQYIENALEHARSINSLSRDIAGYQNELTRLAARKASLLPWRSCDVPLDMPSTDFTSVLFGVCPSSFPFDPIATSVNDATDACKLTLYHTDHEQHYCLLICLSSETAAVKDHLKSYGFSFISLKEYSGTADENIRAAEARERELAANIETEKSRIASLAEKQDILEEAADRLSAELARENARQNLLTTESALLLTGWIPERESGRAESLLHSFDCAYELTDPEEGDSPPVSLYNSRLIYPFNMVTDMYSLPEYGSLDPNPLFAFFFAMFFGIMYADMGYGLVLMTISFIASKKFHLRKGSMTDQLFKLMGICGLTSIFWGAMFGSFFGDVIGVFSENFLGHRFDLPPVAFNPLVGNGPLLLLGICLTFGAVQILFGMGIKAYLLIRDGKPWDAVMDVGSWWLVFAGIAVLALGHGWYVMGAGFLALVLTQGRHSKGFFGKLLGGVGSLYDITSYLSDVLSYSRLMALCMATGVIASVFNILGGLTGPIFFWPIFLVGHTFNMGINIIGTYVHGARLQYLEFFGKWYREGGRAFAPLRFTPKYIDVVNNEQEELSL